MGEVNCYRPHVLVLPEDDANRQIANGFLLEPRLKTRCIQILPIAGGWPKIRDNFQSQHIALLERYPDRYLVLIVDFDTYIDKRAAKVLGIFPEGLRSRVFIIGTRDNPEVFSRLCGMSLESIGAKLASECGDGNCSGLWAHPDLEHNAIELQRLVTAVRPMLFN